MTDEKKSRTAEAPPTSKQLASDAELYTSPKAGGVKAVTDEVSGYGGSPTTAHVPAHGATETGVSRSDGASDLSWDGDQPLPEDKAISDAFPTRSGRHDLYAEAMRLVGAKHSKHALVALVNWLLLERELRRERATPEKPICERCGEEDSDERIYGKVDTCQSCYAGLEYRIDQMTDILQKFIDGGRLESLLLQCENAGIRRSAKDSTGDGG